MEEGPAATTRDQRRSVNRGSANSQIVAYTEGELRSNPGGARERYFVISVAPRLVSVPAHAHPRFGRFSSTGHDSAHYRRQADLWGVIWWRSLPWFGVTVKWNHDPRAQARPIGTRCCREVGGQAAAWGW